MPPNSDPWTPDSNPADQPNEQTPGFVTEPTSNAAAPSLPAVEASPPNNGSQTNPSLGKRSRRKPLLALVLVLLLLGGSAAAYFGLVLPNRPENVWAKALDNTAEIYDQLAATDEEPAQGADFSGSFKVDGPFKTDGSFEGNFWENSGSFKTDVGFGVTRAKLEARFLDSVSDNPDVYLNLSGLKGLDQLAAGSGFEEIINSIDGQWVVIDHTLLDNLQQQVLETGEDQPQTPELTPEDVNDIMVKVGEALDEHVFTDDPAKAAFTVKEAVGREERDGRVVYRFKVEVDKQNLKSFVNTLTGKLEQTKLNELLGDQSLAEAIDKEELLKSIDSLDTSKAEVDAWVDAETKLFNAIRVTEAGSPDNYLEFGTPYTGGDDYPFFLKLAGKENDKVSTANLQLTYNAQSEAANLNLDFAENRGAGEQKFEMQVTATPRDQPLNLEKPADAKPLLEALGPLGQFFQESFGGVPESADRPEPLESTF